MFDVQIGSRPHEPPTGPRQPFGAPASKGCSGCFPVPRRSRNRVRHLKFVALAWISLSTLLAFAGTGEAPSAATNPAAVPFLQFRNRTLEYAGPEIDAPEPEDVSEVRLGWFGPYRLEDPLTGEMWWAAKLAMVEANKQGGYRGHPFRLIPQWSENPWGTGVAAVFKMVYDERIWALIGSVDGPSTHLAEQVVAKARLPLISPVSTDKSVNLAGVPWMFSCAPGDDRLAAVLAQAVSATSNRSPGNVVVFRATDHDSRAAAKELLIQLAARHCFPDFRFDLPAGTAPTAAQLQALQAALPGAILIIANPEDSARLVKAIRGLPLTAPIFGTHHMGRSRFVQLAGPAAEGVRFPLLFQPNRSDPTTQKFIEQFERQFGHEPDFAAALAYDAVRGLIEAVRRAGLNRARIRNVLTQMSPWPGIAGLIQWDGTGQNMRPLPRLGIVRNGRVISLLAPMGQ